MLSAAIALEILFIDFLSGPEWGSGCRLPIACKTRSNVIRAACRRMTLIRRTSGGVAAGPVGMDSAGEHLILGKDFSGPMAEPVR